MQILIFANHSGGLYDFRKDLITELNKHAEVTVAVPQNDRWQELQQLVAHVIEIPIARRGMNPLQDGKLLRRYCAILRKVKPDLVITYTIKPNIYGGLACRMAHIPYAANITGLGSAIENGGWLKRFVLALYKPALKGARVVFFENPGNREMLVATGVVPKGRDVVLNGAGVNLEHYTPVPYPRKSEPVRFLFIGRVMAEKGVDELFAAMERLCGEGIRCCLDVLGGYEEDYAQKIESYTAQGWLCYHGYQQDVRPFIAQAHCFVLPSWHEGMANTNLECAAMARPLITSRIHGCMEAVIKGESGLLCEPKNADSLYDAMRQFCELPNAQREAMGLAGRRHMEEVFDKRMVVVETMRGLRL